MPPQSYTCDSLTEGKIRIVGTLRQKRWDADADESRPFGREAECRGTPIGSQKSAGEVEFISDAMQGNSNPDAGELESSNPRQALDTQGESVDSGGLYDIYPYENDLVVREENKKMSASAQFFSSLRFGQADVNCGGERAMDEMQDMTTYNQRLAYLRAMTPAQFRALRNYLELEGADDAE